MYDLPVRILQSLIRRVRHVWVKYHARNNSFDVLSRCKKENVLVLCYGNIYRSPFVEQAISQNLKGKSASVTVVSAGFYPVVDRMSPDKQRMRATKYDLNLDDHRSKLVTKELFEWADLIVIMDAYNFDAVISFDKKLARKLFWLGSLDNNAVSIEDPYGWSEGAADQLFDRIYLLSKTFSKLLR